MAYNKAAHGNGFNEEFVYSDAELQLIDKYADTTDELHTDLHECLGHGSGKLLPGVDPDALKAYGSTIEDGACRPVRTVLCGRSETGGTGADSECGCLQGPILYLSDERPDDTACAYRTGKQRGRGTYAQPPAS